MVFLSPKFLVASLVLAAGLVQLEASARSLSGAPVPRQDGGQRDWAQRWADLDRLAASEDSLLRDDLAEEQRRLVRTMGPEASSVTRFRIGLFGAAIGQPLPSWGQGELPGGLEPAEVERASALLPAGPARTTALIGLLSEAESLEPEVLYARQSLSFEAFMAEHDAFRIPSATRLAESLYASGPAIWSAYCVEGIARRAGDAARALEVVEEQLAAVLARGQGASLAERVDLLQRRAITAAGSGDLALENASLGRAARLGGDDALQILGKRALENGEPLRARALFRALLSRPRPADQEAPPWALRGWGLSLLPGPR